MEWTVSSRSPVRARCSGVNGRWTHPLFTSLPVSSGVANRFSVHLEVAGVNCAHHGMVRPGCRYSTSSGYSATGITGTSRSRHYNTETCRTPFRDGPVHLGFHSPSPSETDEPRISTGRRSAARCSARHRSGDATAERAIVCHSAVCNRRKVGPSRLAEPPDRVRDRPAVDSANRLPSVVFRFCQMIDSGSTPPDSSPPRCHGGVTRDRSANVHPIGVTRRHWPVQQRRCRSVHRAGRGVTTPTETINNRTSITSGSQEVHTYVGNPARPRTETGGAAEQL
jgi:hypothetical protein